jgi:hypothetical protein
MTARMRAMGRPSAPPVPPRGRRRPLDRHRWLIAVAALLILFTLVLVPR